MKYTPSTIIEQVDKGLQLCKAGSMFMSTKRNGEWIETDVDTFKQKVREFAMGLYSLGIRPGDKVSIHSENSTEWVICDLAIISLGAATVPIYSTQPGEQIEFILRNSGAGIHIVSNDHLFAETKLIIKDVSDVHTVISLSPTNHKKLQLFDDVLKLGREQEKETPGLFEELKSKVRPDSLATLIYTSGTTGMPKGVMLSHNNIASNIQASLERVPFTMDEILNQHILSYLPLSHAFERLMMYLYIVMGGRIHFIESVNEIREDFLTVKPFFFSTVPRLLEKVYTGIKVKGQEFSGLKKRLYYWAVYLAESYDPESPKKTELIKRKIADKLVYAEMRSLFGGNLCGMICGGAALSPGVFRFINALGLYCGQGYGLTETSPVIAVQDPDHLRIGSLGLPLTDVEVKIADDGEILTRGPHIMMGYFKEPEMTKEVMTDDGWLMTGDVGKIDKDGHLYITDRKKSMFKLSTGKYIAPQNIENKVSESGFIEQAVVIGYQRKFCSALIVPNYENILKKLKREGQTIEKPYENDERVRSLIQSEIDKANSHLSPWEKVKKFVLLSDVLTIERGELTPTMKVKRSVITEQYAEEIESMYQDVEDSE